MTAIKTHEKKGLVLFIEDHLDTRILLSEQLKGLNYEVIAMEKGLTALEWLETNQPDIVILDWMLPDMDGIEICNRIRQNSSLSDLPIMMLSALGGYSNNRIIGLQAGANDFMEKPYSLLELEARIKALLTVQNVQKQSQQLLSRYIPKEIQQHIKKSGDTGTLREQRLVTMLFADLREVTNLNTNDPERLIPVLDQFFDTMMQIIHDHHGIIIDITGDEILAAFNLPEENPQANIEAITTAIAMQKAFKSIQTHWKTEGIEISMGIGIHLGYVTVGYFGSKHLQRYTLVGNPVNYTHRLVETAHHDEISVSTPVYQAVKDKLPQLSFARHENIALQGIPDLQTIYKVTGDSITEAD